MQPRQQRNGSDAWDQRCLPSRGTYVNRMIRKPEPGQVARRRANPEPSVCVSADKKSYAREKRALDTGHLRATRASAVLSRSAGNKLPPIFSRGSDRIADQYMRCIERGRSRADTGLKERFNRANLLYRRLRTRCCPATWAMPTHGGPKGFPWVLRCWGTGNTAQ